MSLASHYHRSQQLLLENQSLQRENEAIKHEQQQFVTQLSAQLKLLTSIIRSKNTHRESRPQARDFKNTASQRAKTYNFVFLLLVVALVCFRVSQVDVCIAVDRPFVSSRGAYVTMHQNDLALEDAFSCLGQWCSSVESGFPGVIE